MLTIGFGKSLCYVLLPLVFDSSPEPPEVNVMCVSLCLLDVAVLCSTARQALHVFFQLERL